MKSGVNIRDGHTQDIYISKKSIHNTYLKVCIIYNSKG